jgi:glycosyltransferase involved in cell wall biosynthesis
MRTLLVQGWTGINHSYAMVNQYQLIELFKDDSLNLYSQEMSLFDQRWSKEKNGSGFNDSEKALLEKIKAYDGESVDAIYRIFTPNTLENAHARVITFLVTEFGLDRKNFTESADIHSYCGSGNLVATPSNWSRDRIIDFGFRPDSVFVIPHGVDQNKFSPLSPSERQTARSALGYTSDDVVFLNVGAPIWNKGMDLVIQAFFAARKANKNYRLLIKDQQALYGLSAVGMMKNLLTEGRIELDNASVESIRVLPQTLSIEQLRTLYNVADYYLSPYRAEGFNLPVIEAMACGTKVIVTDGGATDDFCDSNTAVKIPSRLRTNETINNTHIGAYLEPDVEALTDIMVGCALGKTMADTRMQFGRTDLMEQFSWKRASRLISSLVP